MFIVNKVTGQKKAPLQNVWLKKKKIDDLTKSYRFNVNACLERWGATIPEKIQGHKRDTIAIMLENQRLMNEAMSSDSHSSMYNWVKENSVEITRRLWSETHLFDLISVWALLGPHGQVYYRQGNDYVGESVLAKTRKLKFYPYMGSYQDLRVANDENLKRELDEESISVSAYEWKCEIQREVLTDLRNNAGTVLTGNDFEKGAATLASHMGAKIGKILGGYKHPNWMVVPPELVEGRYEPKGCELQKTDIKIAGMEVYVEPLFPQKQYLLGYKDRDEFEPGAYYYCPYVPLTGTPVVFDPEGFCPRPGVLTRYGKKLMRTGACYYGRGNVADVETTVKSEPSF